MKLPSKTKKYNYNEAWKSLPDGSSIFSPDKSGKIDCIKRIADKKTIYDFITIGRTYVDDAKCLGKIWTGLDWTDIGCLNQITIMKPVLNKFWYKLLGGGSILVTERLNDDSTRNVSIPEAGKMFVGKSTDYDFFRRVNGFILQYTKKRIQYVITADKNTPLPQKKVQSTPEERAKKLAAWKAKFKKKAPEFKLLPGKGNAKSYIKFKNKKTKCPQQ